MSHLSSLPILTFIMLTILGMPLLKKQLRKTLLKNAKGFKTESKIHSIGMMCIFTVSNQRGESLFGHTELKNDYLNAESVVEVKGIKMPFQAKSQWIELADGTHLKVMEAT